MGGPGVRLRRARRGYVLLGVLWAVVGLAALAAVAGAAGRGAVAATANRGALTRAAWRAEDCAARALAAVDAAMADGGGALNNATPGVPGAVAPERLARTWRVLDVAVARSPLIRENRGCTVRLEAAGTTLSLALDDHAEGDAMRRLLGALQAPPALADSLVDALLDWRDSDDTPRPAGAEAAWYAAHGRPPPRDGPLAAAAELDRVRGFDAAALDARVPGLHAALQAMVGSGTEPVDLLHAPREVLLTIPGITPEAAEVVVTTRGRTPDAAVDLAAIARRLSPDAAATLGAHLQEAQARAVGEPAAWTVTARGSAGTPAVGTVLELRLVRAGPRAAVVGRRTWIDRGPD